ncbi:MAG: PqiC family protein [Gammaproteobacteria bacterium]|nr:PqiC family protein [Gammaproteobacteria bacterium]
MLLKIFVAVSVLFLSACGTSPKTNFYILSAERSVETYEQDSVSVGVWKVDLPDVIDRPEIVTRTGDYTIELADFHRWAGGLESNISILIANELAHNLKTAHVDVSPWSSYRKFDYQVKVHIRRFDGELGGESVLQGVYLILDGKGNNKILENSFSFTEKLKGKKYSDMAEVMSNLVIQLAEKVSTSISKQHDIKSE